MYQQICGGESTLANAIMDRISYDSYKIDIESDDPSKDFSMRDVYGLDQAKVYETGCLRKSGQVALPPPVRLRRSVIFNNITSIKYRNHEHNITG